MTRRAAPAAHDDASAFVAHHWHLDGPHDAASVTSAAEAVAELLRYLARATLRPWPGVQGGDVGHVVAELSSAGGRSDQVLGQLSRLVATLAEDPTLYDDRHDRPADQTAREAQGALDAARVALGPLVAALTAANEAASHLGHHVEGDA